MTEAEATQTASIIIAVDRDGKPTVLKSREGNMEMPYGLEEFVAALDDLHLPVLLHLAQRRTAQKAADTSCPGNSSSSPSLSLTPG